MNTMDVSVRQAADREISASRNRNAINLRCEAEEAAVDFGFIFQRNQTLINSN